MKMSSHGCSLKSCLPIQIVFCAEQVAVQIKPDQSMACISITNPGDTTSLQNGWGELLRISFADATYSESAIKFFEGMWAASSKGLFVKKHALAIRAFFDKIDIDSIETLVIHCGAGESRSTAVAMYAAREFGVILEGDTSKHNVTVLALLENPCMFDHLLPVEQEPVPCGRGFFSWIKSVIKFCI
jgi:predicted protein tyrosine phosphatase